MTSKQERQIIIGCIVAERFFGNEKFIKEYEKRLTQIS